MNIICLHLYYRLSIGLVGVHIGLVGVCIGSVRVLDTISVTRDDHAAEGNASKVSYGRIS